jgi:hypothetical protein
LEAARREIEGADAFELKYRVYAVARLLLRCRSMSNLTARLSLDAFFEHHLQAVAARLERHTDEALKRQRNAWREALHRQAILDDKDIGEVEGSASK